MFVLASEIILFFNPDWAEVGCFLQEEEDARKTRQKREADRGPAGHGCDQDDQEDAWGLGQLASFAWEVCHHTKILKKRDFSLVLRFQAIEVEFHLREAELKLQARGRSRTRRS